MPAAEAVVTIPTPSRYMVRLVNHFAHRCEVKKEEAHASVAFPNGGTALLDAGEDTLKIRIEAPDAAELERLEEVVAKHLHQVASTETFEITWTPAV